MVRARTLRKNGIMVLFKWFPSPVIQLFVFSSDVAKAERFPSILQCIGVWRDVWKAWLQPEQCQACLEKKGLYLSINTVKGNGWMQMSPIPCLSPPKQGGQDQDH